MAWINLVSNRFEIRQNALKSLTSWKNEHELIGNHKFGLYTLLSGDESLFHQSTFFTEKWLVYYLKKEKVWGQSTVYPTMINLSILLHLAGKNMKAVFSNLSLVKVENTVLNKSLQKLILSYLNGGEVGKNVLSEQITSEKEWVKALVSVKPENLFDLSLCPDHPMWTMLLSHYCLPLSLFLPNKKSPINYFANGFSFQNHTDVLYERQYRKPLLETEVTSDSNTLPGFDAIEIKNNELLFYYWLGFDWQATIDFTSHTLNAFKAFQNFKESINVIKNQVEIKKWQTISAGLTQGNFSCILVIKNELPENYKLLEQNASEKLGMKIKIMNFLKA